MVWESKACIALNPNQILKHEIDRILPLCSSPLQVSSILDRLLAEFSLRAQGGTRALPLAVVERLLVFEPEESDLHAMH